MKQEYRHTKPYRGKDPFFNDEEIEEYNTSRPNRLDEGKPNENQKRFGNENKKPRPDGLTNLEV